MSIRYKRAGTKYSLSWSYFSNPLAIQPVSVLHNGNFWWDVNLKALNFRRIFNAALLRFLWGKHPTIRFWKGSLDHKLDSWVLLKFFFSSLQYARLSISTKKKKTNHQKPNKFNYYFFIPGWDSKESIWERQKVKILYKWMPTFFFPNQALYGNQKCLTLYQ